MKMIYRFPDHLQTKKNFQNIAILQTNYFVWMFCLNSPEKGNRKLVGKRFAHEKVLLCKDFDLIKANHNQSTWVVTFKPF